MWIERDISEAIRASNDTIQIVRGPRQTGKTSLLMRLGQNFEEVSLDDPSLRSLAQDDPELFLSQFGSRHLFIDEAQYAPNLFPSLKRRADVYKREHEGPLSTIIRLTGSNQILLDTRVKESLAGRAGNFELNTLSVAEILGAKELSVQEILYRGGYPELYARDDLDVRRFLDNYLVSYVEKDIVLTAGIQKSREFTTFLKLLAGRVGSLLDYASLARDCGLDSKTAKAWISVLEKMGIVSLLYPFSTNLTSRLVKAPKLYFLDTGLACRLQGWTSAAPILTSPLQGPLFGNLVYCEIYKLIQNYQLSWNLFHWRSRDGEEVDFLIQRGPDDYLFVEVKTSPVKPPNHGSYPEIKKAFSGSIPDLLLCHQEGSRVLGQQVPIAFLKEQLLA